MIIINDPFFIYIFVSWSVGEEMSDKILTRESETSETREDQFSVLFLK